MPFLFRDQAHLERTLYGPVVDVIIEGGIGKRGYRVLGLYTAGVRHIMTKKAINSLDDLKGLKIRTMQNTAHVEAFKALGANPTPLAYGELYGALQAAWSTAPRPPTPTTTRKKFYEVAPNWAMVSWTVLISPLIMSEAKFKSSAGGCAGVLLKAGADIAIVERDEYAKSDNERLGALKKAGVKITTPDPTSFRSAVTTRCTRVRQDRHPEDDARRPSRTPSSPVELCATGGKSSGRPLRRIAPDLWPEHRHVASSPGLSSSGRIAAFWVVTCFWS